MKYLMYENAAILLCAGIGFIMGFRYLQNRKTLYASMIMLGVGCILLGRLYQCVWLWTGGSLTDNFQVGILGTMGAFSFFFSSNYGQFDSLVDNGSEAFAKYRRIAWIAPILISAMYSQIAFSPAHRGFRISCGFACAMIAAACYYHVKHLLIPDADFGIVRYLRNYNAVALCLAVLSVVELVAMAHENEWLLIVSGIGLCAVTLALVPVMDRGGEGMESMTVILFLCATVPMLPALYLIPDKPSRLFLGYMLLGMIVCLIASSVNTALLGLFGGDMVYVSTNITPIAEELMKALPVLYFAIFFSDKRDTLISISYAIGIGFAVLENMVILTGNVGSVTILWAFVRGFGAAGMHSACTSLVGQGISYVRKRRKLFYCGTFSLLISAVIIHALFNTLIQSRLRQYAFIAVVLMYAPQAIKALKQIKVVKQNRE